MLKIHQPYIKRKVRMTFAFASIGVLLLGGLVIASSFSETSTVYATGDSRTIHDISDMQDMTQQICSNTDEGDTATLTDNRDDKTYTIIKHVKDSNCWMQENLKLGGSSAMNLTSSDTDLASGTTSWQLPASSDSSWSSSNTLAQIRVGKSGMTVNSSYPGDGKGWQSNYGNYYSWCAATAGSCSSATSSGAVAGGSICPKNWHLPTGNTNGEFYNVLNGLNFTTVQQSPYLFPAAGSINGSYGFVGPGTHGYYWSSTASGSTRAYYLYFNSSAFYPGTGNNSRYYGFSVRCVAPGGLDKIEKPTWSENKDGNVTVTMPSVISIDATSGMSENANAAEITEGTATATITSNTEYAVTLHSTQPSLKDPKVASSEIPPVSSTNPIQPGHNAWGFWDGTGDANNKSYTLPITTDPQSLYNLPETVTNAEGNPAKKHTYYVGISISPSLPSGTYATNVIITASAK